MVFVPVDRAARAPILAVPRKWRGRRMVLTVHGVIPHASSWGGMLTGHGVGPYRKIRAGSPKGARVLHLSQIPDM